MLSKSGNFFCLFRPLYLLSVLVVTGIPNPPQPSEYPQLATCLDYIVSSQYHRTASVNAFLSIVVSLSSSVSSTTGNLDHNLDRAVARRLELLDPLASETTQNNTPPSDFWDMLLYRCRITDDATLIMMIYKLGLILSAKTLISKQLVTPQELLAAKSQDGKNVMHHAVLSRNPLLVKHLAATLSYGVMQLLTGKDREGNTPFDLTRKPEYDGVGVVSWLRRIYANFEGAEPPTDVTVKRHAGEYYDPAAAALDLDFHTDERIQSQQPPQQQSVQRHQEMQEATLSSRNPDADWWTAFRHVSE